MAKNWREHLIPALRVIIGDVGATYEFSDDRLEELMTVSMLMLMEDIDLENDYTINTIESSISPDLVEEGDTVAQTLLLLKAACFLEKSTLRSRSLIAGLRARLGGSRGAELSTDRSPDALKILMSDGFCQMYERSLLQAKMGNRRTVRAILGPFHSNNFSAENVAGRNSRL